MGTEPQVRKMERAVAMDGRDATILQLLKKASPCLPALGVHRECDGGSSYNYTLLSNRPGAQPPAPSPSTGPEPRQG